MMPFCSTRGIIILVSLFAPSFHGASMSFLRPMNIKIVTLFLFSLGLIMSAPDSYAQNPDPGIDILPAKSLSSDSPYVDVNDATHPPVRLTPDRSELIRLDQEAGTIIIGNEAHLSILADSAKRLVLVPEIPGATHFTILDREGNLLMQRHVIVASPKEKYIRIKGSCEEGSDECVPTRVYYCPDMCHETLVRVTEEEKEDQSLEEIIGEAVTGSGEADSEGEEE